MAIFQGQQVNYQFYGDEKQACVSVSVGDAPLSCYALQR